MRRGFLPRLLLAVAIFDLIFLALPTLVVLAASFTSGNIVTFPPQGFSLRWYANLLDKPDFLAALWRSLQVGADLHPPGHSRRHAGRPGAGPLPAALRHRHAGLSPAPLHRAPGRLRHRPDAGLRPARLAGLGLARGPRLRRDQPAVHDLGGGRGREPSRPRPRARRLELRRPADPRLLHRDPAGACPGHRHRCPGHVHPGGQRVPGQPDAGRCPHRDPAGPGLQRHPLHHHARPRRGLGRLRRARGGAIWLLDRLVGLDLFLKAKQN